MEACATGTNLRKISFSQNYANLLVTRDFLVKLSLTNDLTSSHEEGIRSPWVPVGSPHPKMHSLGYRVFVIVSFLAGLALALPVALHDMNVIRSPTAKVQPFVDVYDVVYSMYHYYLTGYPLHEHMCRPIFGPYLFPGIRLARNRSSTQLSSRIRILQFRKWGVVLHEWTPRFQRMDDSARLHIPSLRAKQPDWVHLRTWRQCS